MPNSQIYVSKNTEILSEDIRNITVSGQTNVYIDMAFSDDGLKIAPSLINYGNINIKDYSSYYFGMSLIYIEGTSSWKNAIIRNDGTMSVTATGNYYGAVDDAWGIRSVGWVPSIINNGSLTVSSGGQSIGIEAWNDINAPFGYSYTPTSPATLNNSGTISVTGASAAFGLYAPYGGTIINSGTISATGPGGRTFAISEGGHGSGLIVNTGLIKAIDTDGKGACAIGFFANGSTPTNHFTIVNFGTITATKAIAQSNETGNGNPISSQVEINNFGTINGAVTLLLGDNIVINQGTINGTVNLGGNNDIYDGTGSAAGTLVYGGGGNDTLIGNGSSTTAGFTGSRANYAVTTNANGTVTVVDQRGGSPDGTETLYGITQLRFTDQTVSLAGSTVLASGAGLSLQLTYGEMLKLSATGAGAAIVNGSSGTIEMSDASATINGNANVITMIAGAGSISALGANNSVSTRVSGTSITVGGNGNASTAANVVSFKGAGSLSVLANSYARATGSHLAITLSAAGTLAVTGGSNTISVSGSGSTLTLGGNNPDTMDTVDFGGNSGNLKLLDNAAANVAGSGLTLTAGSSDVLSVNGSGNTIQLGGSRSSVTVGGNSTVTIVGSENRIAVTGAGTSLTIGGNSQIAAIPNQATFAAGGTVTQLAGAHVALTGNGISATLAGSDTLVITGSNEIVSITGSNDIVSIGGNGQYAGVANRVIATAALGVYTDGYPSHQAPPGLTVTAQDNSRVDVASDGATVFVGNADSVGVIGSRNTVHVSGVGSMVWIGGNGRNAGISNVIDFAAGGVATVLDQSHVDVSGANTTVYVGSNALVNVAGSHGIIHVTGSSSSVTLGGNGQYMTPDTIDFATGGAVTILDNSHVDVTGANVDVTVGAHILAGIVGQSAKVQVAGAASSVWIGGNGQYGASDTITFTQGGTTTILDFSHVDVIGANVTVNVGAYDSVGVIGSGAVTHVTGPGSAVWIGGNGQWAATDTIDFITGGAATILDYSHVDVTGANVDVTVGAHATVGVVGNGETVHVMGADSAVWLGGNGYASSDTIDFVAGGSLHLLDASRVDVAGAGVQVWLGANDLLGLLGHGQIVRAGANIGDTGIWGFDATDHLDITKSAMIGIGAEDPWLWLLAHASVSNGDTTITLGNGNTLVLHGYTLGANDQGNFGFL